MSAHDKETLEPLSVYRKFDGGIYLMRNNSVLATVHGEAWDSGKKADRIVECVNGYEALQQRCEELVDIAHECQKIIKELCACYSHHEPIATLERIEAIKQVQP